MYTTFKTMNMNGYANTVSQSHTILGVKARAGRLSGLDVGMGVEDVDVRTVIVERR